MNTDSSPIRIVIADDHEIFIDGFKTLLSKMKTHGLEYVGSALNGKELVELTGKAIPDIVFTDIQMPQMNGIEATKIIKTRYPQIKVIALSTFNESSFILDMVEAGASGYLLKNTNKEELLTAVRTVSEGNMYYCPETSVHLAKEIKEHTTKVRAIDLSENEKQIVILVCKGLTSKEIADHLHLSKRTVESYKEKIAEKFGVTRSAEIIIYAVKHGIFIP